MLTGVIRIYNGVNRGKNMYAEYSKIIKFDTLPDPTDTWELVDKIGEGTYGEVHSARNKHTGKGMHAGCLFCFVLYRDSSLSVFLHA